MLCTLTGKLKVVHLYRICMLFHLVFGAGPTRNQASRGDGLVGVSKTLWIPSTQYFCSKLCLVTFLFKNESWLSWSLQNLMTIESERFEAFLQPAGSADRWGTRPPLNFLFYTTTSLWPIVENLCFTFSVQTLNFFLQTSLLLLCFKFSLRHATCDVFVPDLSSSVQFCFFKQKAKKQKKGRPASSQKDRGHQR